MSTFKKSRGIKYIFFLGCGLYQSCAQENKGFSGVAHALLSACACSAWLVHKSIWVFVFLVTLQQTQAVVSLLPLHPVLLTPAFSSARRCECFTCHHLLLLQSRRWHFAGNQGEPHHSFLPY